MIIYENKNRGFTIIELIVVVAIIAVLAAVVTINVLQYMVKAKVSATKTEIKYIAGAMDMYRTQHDCLPAGVIDDPDECLYDGGAYVDQDAWDAIIDELVTAGVIGDGKSLHNDPWGNPYVYDKNDYDNGCSPIWSFGPNGEDDSGWDGSNYNCPKEFLEDDIGVSLSF